MSGAPGQTVEGITIPLGDPETLMTSARRMQGLAARLRDSGTQISASPFSMLSWAGPGSSAYAQLTQQEGSAVMSASTATFLAALGIQDAGEQLQDAQRAARRAIERAEQARDAINQAKEDIRQAIADQRDARARMDAAMDARAKAEAALTGDVVAGTGLALAALQAADDAYRAAEQDWLAAERREQRARDRLAEAEDDLERARKAGREAAEDAEDAGIALRGALAQMPSFAPALAGTPAAPHLQAAAGIRLHDPRRPAPAGPCDREPPPGWPGWAQSWFKLGRGVCTAGDGMYGTGKAAVENPTRIPGAIYGMGERAVTDPIGTGKALVGYEELANGRWEDWLGQMGTAALTGGAASGAAARGTRLTRIHGTPRLEPVDGRIPVNGTKFAGRRFDFTRPDLGMRSDTGLKAPKLSDEDRLALAQEYPRGVQFTRAGFPIFTPYAVERVTLDGLTGDNDHDDPLAEAAAGLQHTPRTHTWHHLEDGRTMELVPSDLHSAVRHTGGRPAIRADEVGVFTPGSMFTTGEQLTGATAGAGGHAAVAGGTEANR